MQGNPALHQVHFDCRFELEPQGLRIIYTVRNDADMDVALQNRIASRGPDQNVRFLPDEAYIDLEGSVLAVRLASLPLPKDRDLDAMPAPAVTIVSARSSLTETLFLAEPIKVQHPIRRMMLSPMYDPQRPLRAVVAVVPKTAEDVSFSLELGFVGPGPRVPITPEYPQVYGAVPYTGVPDVRTATFKPGRPVRVLDYDLVEMEIPQ